MKSGAAQLHRRTCGFFSPFCHDQLNSLFSFDAVNVHQTKLACDQTQSTPSLKCRTNWPNYSYNNYQLQMDAFRLFSVYYRISTFIMMITIIMNDRRIEMYTLASAINLECGPLWVSFRFEMIFDENLRITCVFFSIGLSICWH